MKNNASQTYKIFLLIGDFMALIAAFVGGYILRVSISDAPIAYQVSAATYLNIFLAVTPFWILIFALLGLYTSSIYEKRFTEFGRLFIGSFIGLLFVVFLNFASSEPLFPAKLVPIYGFVLAFLFLVIVRTLIRIIRTELFRAHIGLENVLIAGNNPLTTELIELIHDSRTSGFTIVGIIGSEKTLGTHTAIPAFRNLQEALAHLKRPVHTIIQTELYSNESHNRELLEYAQANHVSYRFVPGNTELFVGNLDVELFRGSVPVIAVSQTALVGWGRVVKRIFDFAVSLLAIVILSPVLLVIALCVKLSDGGPVFLRQMRLTRFNREFRVFKFRTMKQSVNGLLPEEAFAKLGKPELAAEYRANGDFIKADPRITRIGRFLRASSLDELPQLFNILKGDISLVGPRALVPRDLNRYDKRHTILSVKSGMTGLAQVSGRKNISFEERRKLDIYYVQNWSFWLDLTIILKTIRVVLMREGAE